MFFFPINFIWYTFFIVCDAAIISDIFNLDLEHDRKVSKYNIQDVQKWMLKNASVGIQRFHPDVDAFICNWRGVMAEKLFML